VKYLYKNDRDKAGERLAYLEKIEDENTFDWISKVGLKRGDHCLELGAGRGSVAKHLCDIVGPEGSVLAVDIDTRFLKDFGLEQLSVAEGDIEEVDLGENKFDFIHTRHVLFHIAGYKKVLENLYWALKPGGWILVEESDFYTWEAIIAGDNSDIQLFNNVVEKILNLYKSKGLDIGCGTECYRELSGYDHSQLSSGGRCRLVQGQSSEAQFHRITMEQLMPSLAGEEDIEEGVVKKYLDLYLDTNFHYRTRMTNSVLVQKG
jgi:precorrin-6B methylase 2